MGGTEYSLAPPDGGWGFVIVMAIAVTNFCTFMPLVTFGIIFGGFMRSLGDEAGGTGFTVGLYFFAQWSTGLLANVLLQKMSYRKVGVMGAVLNFIGMLGGSFATNLYQFVLSFSVIQGIGYGLMLPAMLTAFNLYFDKRKAMAYNFATIILILSCVPLPAFGSFLLENFGFRGANLIESAIALNCLPVMMCLHPVEWYAKKRKVSLNQINAQELTELGKLIEKKGEAIASGLHEDGNLLNSSPETEGQNVGTKSICPHIWNSLVRSLDLGLFTDPIYVNVIIGMSLCISADFSFLSSLPLLLTSFRVNSDDATLILTIFYVADIFGRVGLFTLSACAEVRNRNLLLVGAILASCFRTAFVMDQSFWSLLRRSARRLWVVAALSLSLQKRTNLLRRNGIMLDGKFVHFKELHLEDQETAGNDESAEEACRDHTAIQNPHLQEAANLKTNMEEQVQWTLWPIMWQD
ncbi:monocarboxylate transporter 7-like [Photinus pyralis]|uniref:monocarboxylate transporter 7-like n=1 Tax=Photinus pyralis TaxID=7054 RepID=UPI001267666F|nr:monocarboxylate transporter 7-like [Photinus pyralis]